MWVIHPKAEQNHFNDIPAVFLHLALPTTGIKSVTGSMRARIMKLRDVLVGKMKGLFRSPPSPVFVFKAVWAGTWGIFFFSVIPHVDIRVWLWGKWNTHHSRFMDQRWHRHSAATAHCQCGAETIRRVMTMHQTEMCFELMGCLLVSQQQKVLHRRGRHILARGSLLIKLKDCFWKIIVYLLTQKSYNEKCLGPFYYFYLCSLTVTTSASKHISIIITKFH